MKVKPDCAAHIRPRVFLRGIVFPLAVLILTLKFLRVMGGVRNGDQYAGVMHLFRSDILILLVFSLLGLSLLSALSGRRGRIALGALQLISVVWAGIETMAHQFFIVTGSTIDFGIFLFSIQRLGDIGQVVVSEIPAVLILLLSLVVLILLLLPWYIAAYVSSNDTQHKSGRRGWVALCGMLFVSSAWSIMPLSGKENPGIARSNLINLAFSIYKLDDEFPIIDIKRESLKGLSLTATSERVQRKNLVLVILESTRASATTLYNPTLLTTPFLNSLKEQSLLIEHAYAVVPHTSKALVAIHCGIEPHLTMPITEADSSGIPATCIPELLAEAGYRSVFFQSATNQFEQRHGLVSNLGFQDFFALEQLDAEGMEQANYFSVEDAVMLPKSLEWLSAEGTDQPFLATYLTGTPHHDYRAPSSRYGIERFSESDELNRYLNSVRYVDQFIRELIEQYKNLGLLGNTLFVFVGDHGEAFREHGRSQHDNIMWQEGLHIPLLIYNPADPQGEVISNPITQLDLLPSLVHLLGYRLEGGNLPGKLIWQAGSERTLYAHCWYELGCMAAIEKNTKYIEHFGKQPNEFYDLRADPKESIDLHSKLGTDYVARIRAELFSWRQAVNRLYEQNVE